MLHKLDIFIAHAWRNHEQWMDLVNGFDSIEHLTWRNFSVPWHDPALHPSRPNEYDLIKDTYETQIIPADVSIVIFDLYAQKSNVRWLDLCVDISKQYDRPLFGIHKQKIEDYGFTINFLNKFSAIEESVDNITSIIADKYSKPTEFRYI